MRKVVPAGSLLAMGFLIVWSVLATASQAQNAKNVRVRTGGRVESAAPRIKPPGLQGRAAQYRLSPHAAAAMVDLCLALLNSNEFIYVD